MIRLGPLVALLVLPAAAAAQPVSFQLKNDVPAGQKPTLTLMAMERVLEVKLDLNETRDIDLITFCNTYQDIDDLKI